MPDGGARRLRMLAGALLGTVGLIGIGGAGYWAVFRVQQHQNAGLVAAAAQAATAGAYDEAFRLYARASQAAPDMPGLAKAAAIAALGAGRGAEAVSYARRAWDAGMRDEMVAGALLAQTSSDAQGVAYAQEIIAAVDDPAGRLRLRARVQAGAGRFEEAERTLTELVATAPDAQGVAALGEVRLRLGRISEAREVLEAARVKQQLDATGYRQLGLAWYIDNLNAESSPPSHDCVALYAEAAAAGRVDDALRYDHGLHLLARLDYTGAEAQWQAIGPGVLQVDARLLREWLAASREGPAAADISGPPLSDGAQAEGMAVITAALRRNAGWTNLRYDLEKAERLLGERPPLHLLIALQAMRAGDWSAARDRYSRVTGLLATTTPVVLDQATVEAQLGHRDEALALLMVLHRQTGPTKRSLLLLEALLGPGASPELIAAMQHAADGRGEDPELRAMAQRLAQPSSAAPAGTAERDAALAEIRNALQAGDHRRALTIAEGLGLAPVYRTALRGFVLQAAGSHREAVTAFAEARAAGEQPVPVHVAESVSALAIGDSALALAAAGRALALARDDADAWQARLLAQLMARDPVAARADLAQMPEALRMQPAIGTAVVRLLAFAGDLPAAQRQLDALSAVLEAPRAAVLGALLQQLGRRPGAALLLLQPHLADAEAALAWTPLALNNIPGARIPPVLAPLALPPMVLLDLADLAARQQRWDAAAGIARLALNQAPDDVRALNDWAWYAMHIPDADTDAVRDAALRACALAPERPEPLDTAAAVQLGQGRYEAVLTMLDQAPPALVGHAQFTVHRARALAALGRSDEARTAWRAALAAADAAQVWPLRESRDEILRVGE